MKPDGTLTVRAPMKMPESEILKFCAEHRDWIASRAQESRLTFASEADLFEYRNVSVFGERFEPVFTREAKRVALCSDRLCVPVKFYDGCMGEMKGQARALNAIARFFAGTAADYFNARVPVIAGRFGFSYAGLRINNCKRIWGSCKSSRMLSFNYRAVMLPVRLIDYLIVHELAHTLELNHSKKFWGIVAEALPDYKARRAELKKKSWLQELFR
jgi:predicted metal-dependent hydrolase